MPPPAAPRPAALDLRPLSPSGRLAAQHDAAAALAAGKIAVLPGDTGYFVCACAATPAGLELSRAAERAGSAAGLTAAVWLAPGMPDAETLPDLTRIGAKLIRLLTPGPVAFRVGLDEEGLSTVRARLGVAAGVIDDGRSVPLRLPAASLGATLSQRSAAPVCAWEPADAQGRSFSDPSPAADAAAALGLSPALILADEPPTAGGRRARPTVIDLPRSGAVRVLSEGAYESRYVMKHAALNILLVCTGNTCRSPMAEAIGAGLAAKSKGPALQFSSAGIGAIAGSARTREGVQAVRTLGYQPTRGSSRPITRQMIADADVILTMTRSHRQGVLAIDPSAADKTFLLDPRAEDIPDPIGMPQDAYDQTAARLESLLRERLKEWGSPACPNRPAP